MRSVGSVLSLCVGKLKGIKQLMNDTNGFNATSARKIMQVLPKLLGSRARI